MEQYIVNIALMAIPILLAVTVHEVSHGWVAFKLGDPTARDAGRLSFNPIKHLDPMGTLVFLVTQMVGWAKPVPVNFGNLRHPKRDMIWVSLAGPAANMVLAVGFALLFHLFFGLRNSLPYGVVKPIIDVCQIGIMINIGLAVFNLIPIPPLDGSKIAMGLLPMRQARLLDSISPYGFIILLVLIFTQVISKVVFPIILFLANILLLGF